MVPLHIALPHVTLRGITFNKGAPKRILALHGWLDNAMSFAPLASEMLQAEWMAIEWPGHGHSDHAPSQYALSYLNYLQDLHALLQMSPPFDAVVGHSLGGIIANIYHNTIAPLPNLILIEGGAPLHEASESAGERLKNSLLEQHRALSKVNSDKWRSIDMIDKLARVRARKSDISSELATLLVKRNMRFNESGSHWCWRSDPRLLVTSPFRLNLEQAQTLIKGDRGGQLILATGGYERLKALPNWLGEGWRTTLVEGGHHCHMTSPKVVAAAMDLV